MDREQPATVDPAPSHRRWAVPVAIVALVVIMVGAVASVIYVGSKPSDDAVAAVTVPGAATEPVRVVPGLGKLTWTKLEGPAAEFGQAGTQITFSPEDGYRLFSGSDRVAWESADGLDWTLRNVPQGFGDFAFEHVGSGAYAMGASTDGRQTLARWAADHWVVVDDFGPITETIGIVWRFQFDEPVVQVDDAALAYVRLYGELPWGEIYGYFQRSNCTDECPQKSPKAKWDPTAQRLLLLHPFDETPVASLRIDVAGDTATLVDIETQEVVHEVVGTAGMPIHDIVDALQSEAPTRRYVQFQGNLVSNSGGGFVYLRPPWNTGPPRFTGPAIFAAPDGSGFVAYEVKYDESTDPVDRDVVTEVRTWTSEDAIEWTEASAPPFPYPWAGSVILWSRPGAIVAEFFPSNRGARSPGRQLWESPDGVVWTERPAPPIAVPVRGMEFGYATSERVEDLPSSGRWSWRYWVLGDGDAWVEVVAPPAQPVPVGDGGYAWNHEVGSNMYWGYGDASSTHLWVGRFES